MDKNFKIIRKVADRKSTLPALGHVHIFDGWRFATDLDMAIFERIRPGDYGCSGEEASFTYAGHQLPLACENVNELWDGKVNPATTPDDSWVEAPWLNEAIHTCFHATVEDKFRYYLNGMFIDCSDKAGGITCVGCDGNRLAKLEFPNAARPDANSIIVPRDLLKIMKMSALKKARWIVQWSGDLFRAYDEVTELLFVSKTIDGTYPDYRRVIPQAKALAPYQWEAHSKAWGVAVQPHLTYGDPKKKAIVLEDCTITQSQKGLPDLKTTFSGVSFLDGADGSNPRAGFNAKYLYDALAQMDGVAELQMRTPADPARLSCANRPNLVCVIMPMRV